MLARDYKANLEFDDKTEILDQVTASVHEFECHASFAFEAACRVLDQVS